MAHMAQDYEDWKSRLRRHPDAAGLEDEVLDEVAEHAGQVWGAGLQNGATSEEALARVEGELAQLNALVRAARVARQPRPPLPSPVPPPGRGARLAGFAGDLRYGLRLLIARPAFSAIAVLTLALGIGANTAIFSVIDTVLLQPPAFPDASRLVMLWEASVRDPADSYIVAAPNYRDWIAQSTAFEASGLWEIQAFNVSGGAEPEQVRGARVSAGTFEMLQVAPALGRTFAPSEDAPGHQVAIIGDALWRGRFGARPDVLGQTLRINGRPFEIIGVMPPSFRFMNREMALWVPIQLTEQDDSRSAHSFLAAARLKPGVSLAAARRELERIAARVEREHPENRGETATMTPMAELGVKPLQSTLLLLLAAVTLVLLIACVNVANLLLAQGSVRQREFAVRAALGAGRARLTSQLLAEGLVLAAAGGAAGLALAWLGTTVLAASLPFGVQLLPFRDTSIAVIEPRVLAFTAIAAVVTGLTFSMAPVLGLRSAGPMTALKVTGTRGSTGSFQGLRPLLLSVQIALAVVVLAAAGLMVKSLARLVAVDPGLDPRNLLVLGMALPQPDAYGPPVRTAFCSDLEARAGSVPGVQSASAVSHLPLSGANAGRAFVIDGRPEPAPNQGPSASFRISCPGYFSTLGIPLVRGRDFTHADTLQAPMVAIVNQLTADAYWPGADPIGQRIKFGSLTSDGPWMTVVGVVGNVRHFGLDADSRRELFRPYSQRAWPAMTVTVKGKADPRPLVPALRAALAGVDPDQPILGIRTMDQVVDESLGTRRFPMLLLSVFSLVALALAVVGVYGVVSYLVSQRTREIGIRVALGARARQVTAAIVMRSLAPVATGLGLGLAGALAAARAIDSLLFHVTPYDPMVLGSIVVVIGACAGLACLVPARRAARIDPLVALRQE